MTLTTICPVCKKKSYTTTGTRSHLFNATKTELMTRYVLGLETPRPHTAWMRKYCKQKTSLSFTIA